MRINVDPQQMSILPNRRWPYAVLSTDFNYLQKFNSPKLVGQNYPEWLEKMKNLFLDWKLKHNVQKYWMEKPIVAIHQFIYFKLCNVHDKLYFNINDWLTHLLKLELLSSLPVLSTVNISGCDCISVFYGDITWGTEGSYVSSRDNNEK